VTATTAQIQPIGAHPNIDVLFVGALLWCKPTEAVDVLAFVENGDVESSALATVLSAVRALANAGKPLGPQVVLDEIRRTGALNAIVADQVRAATTSGADPGAARHYGAGVVAEALRRRIDSAGTALTAAAADAAEADLAPLVTRAAESVRDCADRLAALRGGIW
jgi:hypothetical protein